MLLPHEVLHQLAGAGDLGRLTGLSGLDSASCQHMHNVNLLAGRPLIPCGMWGDAVPWSFDKRLSCEMWVLSFPGLPGDDPWRAVRIPLTVLPREVLVPGKTMDEVLTILRKSWEASVSGVFPNRRLDDKVFGKGDGWRKLRAGRTLNGSGVVCELRGDWKMYKDWGSR